MKLFGHYVCLLHQVGACLVWDIAGLGRSCLSPRAFSKGSPSVNNIITKLGHACDSSPESKDGLIDE